MHDPTSNADLLIALKGSSYLILLVANKKVEKPKKWYIWWHLPGSVEYGNLKVVWNSLKKSVREYVGNPFTHNIAIYSHSNIFSLLITISFVRYVPYCHQQSRLTCTYCDLLWNILYLLIARIKNWPRDMGQILAFISTVEPRYFELG